MERSVQSDKDNQQQSAAASSARRSVARSFAPRPSGLGQLANNINRSPRVQALAQLKEDIQRSSRVQGLQRLAAEIQPDSPAQLEEQPTSAPNHTGLPDQLKAGVESLSGLSLDDVKVHYNSAKPAQLNALAYAQGTDIHVAPGQDQHLPHEAWHIVQQKQGRVRPTMQMKPGVPFNNGASLENEADATGARVVVNAVQRQVIPASGAAIVDSRQRPGRRAKLEQARAECLPIPATPPIQARFNIELLFADPAKREMLFAEGIGIDDLEEIQELLEDSATVDGYLQELEQSMERFFKDPDSEYKYTRALDMALFEQEKKWMVPQEVAQPEKRSTGFREEIPGNSGVESQETFLGRIRGAKPLKDVGAPVAHGEYAHRIQWYVISRAVLSIKLISAGLLKRIYAFLGEEDFLDDKINNYVNNTWSLWGAVVDVPGGVVRPKDPQPGKSIGNVGFSAPVDLTAHISGGQGGLQYSQLRLAVLNRRIKRYFEQDVEQQKKGKVIGRSDLELAKVFKGIRDMMAAAKLPSQQSARVLETLALAGDYAENGKHQPFEFDYDQRNEIAFALCGIPLS